MATSFSIWETVPGMPLYAPVQCLCCCLQPTIRMAATRRLLHPGGTDVHLLVVCVHYWRDIAALQPTKEGWRAHSATISFAHVDAELTPCPSCAVCLFAGILRPLLLRVLGLAGRAAHHLPGILAVAATKLPK